ncbi:MAG: hypothetical protein JWM23_576 [Microbacteriaceae bacterium]|nr:hypothetical protein [Microbacteriaceae bacterium]
MATITPDFTSGLSAAVLAANRALGVSPSAPHGAQVDDAIGRTDDLHDAAREMLTAIENIQNWQAEVNHALRELGIYVPLEGE